LEHLLTFSVFSFSDGRRRLLCLPAEVFFASEFVSFPPLGLHGLAWCLSGQLASALSSIPRFDKIEAGPLIPGVTVPGALQRNESPLPACLANFLDDPNSFNGATWNPLVSIFRNL
jgi:hypothetical protein